MDMNYTSFIGTLHDIIQQLQNICHKWPQICSACLSAS